MACTMYTMIKYKSEKWKPIRKKKQYKKEKKKETPGAK
jgi:hypothetical protein